MFWLWYLLLAAVVVVLVIIIGITSISVLRLPKARLERCEAEDDEEERALGEASLGEQWLTDHGFHWVGAYRFSSDLGTMLVRAWQQGDNATYLCQYLTAQDTARTDIVSIFSTDPPVGLTTGTTADTHLLPDRPGVFKQSLSDRQVEHLWRYHTEGEALVAEVTGVDPQPVELSFEEVVSRAIREQMAYVRTLPLWPLRAPYWYLVRRHRLHNWPLARLIERGMVDTPRLTPSMQQPREHV